MFSALTVSGAIVSCFFWGGGEELGKIPDTSMCCAMKLFSESMGDLFFLHSNSQRMTIIEVCHVSY